MQHCEMDPEWMQWIPCSVAQWIPIECSGLHEAWLNVVHSMQSGALYLDWMKWIACSLAQWIPMECSWSMQCSPMDPDWMQWLPCSIAQWILIECSGFHAAWLNAVDSMQREEIEPYCKQWIICSMIECSRFHAASLNAVDSMLVIECSVIHAAW